MKIPHEVKKDAKTFLKFCFEQNFTPSGEDKAILIGLLPEDQEKAFFDVDGNIVFKTMREEAKHARAFPDHHPRTMYVHKDGIKPGLHNVSFF